jgi:hypothetical protein
MSISAVLPHLARAGRLLTALILIPGALAVRADPAVAIFVRAYNGYTRTRLPDNSFKPESYTFVEGGRHNGSMVDKSIDNLSFYTVARTIAEPLKKRGYVPSFDAKHTDLAIFVFWGTTTGAENGRYSEGELLLQDALREYADAKVGIDEYMADPKSGGQPPAFGTTEANTKAHAESAMDQALMMQSLANRARDENNLSNAGILGYRSELQRAWEIPWFSRSRDVVSELEGDRYFVVLKAFDYGTLVFKKKWKLLWESRFSIPAQGNAFDRQLAMMATRASLYFGENVKHLIRESVREGKVEVGTPKVIETEPK